jgi:capsular exopolysaccharide synthesis family protein
MILALLIGLMGGVGLAFLFDYLDDSVKNAWDIEKYAALPTLGVVPTFSPDRFSRGYGYGYGYGHRKKSRRSPVAKNLPGLPVEDRTNSAATQSGSDPAASRLESSPAREGEKKKEEPIKSIELITHFAPKSNFSESYRSIRTSLLLSSAEPNLKAIVVTSPIASEGKTATVANLAVTLAQMEKRVLIIDSDLRKPKQHRIFKIKNINGLTNYLAADVDLKELIKQTRIPNLYLINSGPIPPNPAELLGSEKMVKLIEDLKQQFNYILFDTPPILAVSDALVLGPMIDGMILIVWGEKTSREVLKRAKEKLDLLKIKTLGAVINNLNIRRSGYYYKYYHYYHYHYYGEQ